MSTPEFPKSCYLYAYVWVKNVYISGSLKHSMINTTMSGFPKMPLSIFVYLCHKRWPSVYAYMRVPKSAATYKPLLVFPNCCSEYACINVQKCPCLCMSHSGSLQMPLQTYICLHYGFQTFTLYLRTLSSQKKPFCACLYFDF